MHRLTHLHAVCPNRPDSAARLLPFQLQTKTRGGGTNPGDGACGPWGSLLPPRAPCGCWRWELLRSEGGFSLLHSACVTLPFFSRSTVIRSPPASRGAGGIPGSSAVRVLRALTACSVFMAARRARVSEPERRRLPRSPGSGSERAPPAARAACAPRF